MLDVPSILPFIRNFAPKSTGNICYSFLKLAKRFKADIK